MNTVQVAVSIPLPLCCLLFSYSVWTEQREFDDKFNVRGSRIQIC